MSRRLTVWFALLLSVLVGAAAIGACSGDGNGTSPSSGSGGAGGGGSMTTFVGSGGAKDALDIQPAALQTITIDKSDMTPTVKYTATLNGESVAASWSVDRVDVGGVKPGPASGTTFAPKGTAGGLVTVRAASHGLVAQRQVLVKLRGGTQNGPNLSDPGEQAQIPGSVGDLKAGGGVGGVGGEGLGVAVTDQALIDALKNPDGNGSAQGLTLLYPYDKTIWPRGMLAPLLMWKWSGDATDASAIRIELSTTTGSFSWSGIFGRPAILAQTGGLFIRHPIPQDVWNMATTSAQGNSDKLTIKVTIATGGKAYGPLTQTWVVAPARLTGTVYYNSYGTQLVKNWTSLDGAGHPVGAAILGVRSGDTGPKLVVGKDSPLDVNGNPTNNDGCRVCHVVASRGRWLITQSEEKDNQQSYLYDLNATDVQGSAVPLSPDGIFAWAAMTGNGSFALANTINPSSSNRAIANSLSGTATSSFWQFGGAPVAGTLTGLPAGVAAGYPSYSPDDKLMAYIDVTGATQDVRGPLILAKYNAANKTFSDPKAIHSPEGEQRIGYPSFLPDNSGILFETDVRSGGDSVVVTRNGARSELWWINLNGSKQAVPLLALNGKNANGSPYVPIGHKNHGIADGSGPGAGADESSFDDTTLQYEPTLLPIVSGGYAWVVFTSRRLYGNQLTEVPWLSWPPDYDTTDLGRATVKKLWVAAIDLNAPAGSDPSHPAFYLPAQEILAGNSRGFWVLDPCRADGASCESGDQCCNGFCQPDDEGELVCSKRPPGECAEVQEKCSSAEDCCEPSNLCVNGFCAQSSPN